MPSISKIRLTNVIYEEGNKRYNNEIFLFDGQNSAILLENGGGKTVFIQTALQAILPHTDLADRKIKNTLMLENAPAHIAIEWITNDNPRHYVVTAVSLFTTKQGIDSLRYVYDYGENDANSMEEIPFVKEGKAGKRTAEKGEMQDYYSYMREKSLSARTFQTIKEYKQYIEEQFQIITSEWESIAKINSSEGGVEAFFDDCKNTNQLFDRLLIPIVENSIVGHDTQLFANTFEQQHASLKNYQNLKETLEENKQIQRKLEDFTKKYEVLHFQENVYEKTKQFVKGLYKEAISQKESYLAEQQSITEKWKEWFSSNHLYEVKEASFDILQEEWKFQNLDQAYKESYQQKNDKEENLKRYKKEFYSLKLKGLKNEKRVLIEALTNIEAELKMHDQKEEVQDFREQLVEVKATLLGWYEGEFERLEKNKQEIRYQLNPIMDGIASKESKQRDLLAREKEIEALNTQITTTINYLKKDMGRIKQQILANPEQEKVEAELLVWQHRAQHLDQEIIRLEQEMKQFLVEIKEAEQRKEEVQLQVMNLEKEMDKISYNLSLGEQAEKKLIKELATLYAAWNALDTVYLKQESIEHRITETLVNVKKEKEKLLDKERMAHRFVDDYANQDIFFGDSYLEKQLWSWKNQLDYVVTGVEYLQELDEAEKQAAKQYPLWPITLVTTQKSKLKLLDRISNMTKELQYPIVVLTTEEALTIQDYQANENWVVPSHWQANSSQNHFAEWKKQVSTIAKEATLLREEKELEVKKWQDAQQTFRNFLETYPFARITEWKNQQNEAKALLENLEQQLQKEKKLILSFQDKGKKHTITVKDYRDEKNGLEGKIDKGTQYVQYAKEVLDVSRKEIDTRNQLVEIKKELIGIERQLTDFKEEKEYLDEQISRNKVRAEMLQQEEEYKSLGTIIPIFSNEDKSTIKEKMFSLEMKIREITVAEGELLAKREANQNSLNKVKNQIEELQKEHPYIDETIEFLSDHKLLQDQLWNQMQTVESEIEKLVNEVERRNTRKERQHGIWQLKVKQFKEKFLEEVVHFTKIKSEIMEELAIEKEALLERKAYLEKEEARIKKELTSIGEAILGMDLFEDSHHFKAPHIVPFSIAQEEILTFTYNRQKYIDKVVKELKQNKQLVETEQTEVEKSRRKFREFCNREISNIKLQQMAITGLDNKQNYEDLLEFKKNMLLRIEKISNYAMEHIRQSDEDLQFFINQIHSHLQTLVEEINQIPKKTRVKVEDDWKQIYTFKIPEWEEDAGKMRIRDYIEWILQQLDSERFLNDLGQQDTVKIRKETEKWLQTKQLLQVVMSNDVLKVNCRKVTNDNKVSTRNYSWEQSNVWSGGEKWSKNMTLFLGILNYVAEKKKHQPTNRKRNRVVILDNPFGKASSDHVLSPVFFVAEQLGFQIIALTAHAEGKFLQDYFPILYSCRLRPSNDASKKIMTKEKWLHHAFFQDHEPQTIDRLGETEQMTLFE
ncbi:hypothetical protein [Bacillus sp. 522_BSPC]|uniref:hypothetical protein n=1 Tax=Bacillus sp. 522_BSPC TaxID=1579338 RepID=UPI00065FD076|nr:hypothetical protein [Bacillus sp. 522_BSPC]